MLSASKFSFFMVFIFSSGWSSAQDVVLPDIVKVGEGGLIKSELIYSLDNKPTPECHASTIEEIEGGFIAAWFGGKHEKKR